MLAEVTQAKEAFEIKSDNDKSREHFEKLCYNIKNVVSMFKFPESVANP